MAGRLAAIGERAFVEGYGLAGATVAVADDAAEVRRAWHALPPDVAVVVLTAASAGALGAETDGRLVVVLP
jgi:vacuolar-type H+-ATPase subunit F/Vma7